MGDIKRYWMKRWAGKMKEYLIENAERLYPGDLKKQEKYMADVVEGKVSKPK